MSDLFPTGGLQKKSAEMRLKVLEMIKKARLRHFGGIYSCMDLLVALYYGPSAFRYRVNDPDWNDRDRLIVGKGHACLGIYAILADVGIISKSELSTYGVDGSIYGGQLDFNIPGVETNTGSLGHAIGIATGLAMAKSYPHMYALVGDGECEEGSIWESVMFAAQKEVNNLTVIVDRNRLSVTDFIENDNLEEKFIACGWDVDTINGHNFDQICDSLEHRYIKQSKPRAIIADTIKGKGVSFMESGIKWHHSVPTDEEFNLAEEELKQEIAKWQ
ncbi:MAG TPA: transketolase [Maribacter sp.]|nr:transketolase [Maribacter sp.]